MPEWITDTWERFVEWMHDVWEESVTVFFETFPVMLGIFASMVVVFFAIGMFVWVVFAATADTTQPKYEPPQENCSRQFDPAGTFQGWICPPQEKPE